MLAAAFGESRAESLLPGGNLSADRGDRCEKSHRSIPILGWIMRSPATSRKSRLLAVRLCVAILNVALAGSARAELVDRPGHLVPTVSPGRGGYGGQGSTGVWESSEPVAPLVAAPGMTYVNFEALLPRVSPIEHSWAQIGRLLVELDKVFAEETRTAHDGASEGSTVTEHRETYKGREIVVRSQAHADDTAPAAAAPAEPELIIDNKPVFTIRNSSGAYIASGFAFAPQASLVELGKRIIDRDTVQ
jgi:hypothetical protein